MTVTVPGTRQEIAKLTCRKVHPPQIFKKRLLAGPVDAIWTDLENTTKKYFHPNSARVLQYSKSAYNYLHVHGGYLLREMRSLFAKVQLIVLAEFPRALVKTNGIRISTSAERAA